MTVVTRKRLARQKGRSGGDSNPFAMLPVEVLTSEAVRTLPHSAFRVLVALAAQYFGVNNGSLTLTRRTAIEYGIGNQHTLLASLRELEVRRLIVRTRLGTRLPPRAAMYAVTWRKIDASARSDPHDLVPTLRSSDAWRTWTAATRQPHWTTARRAARWRKATSAGGARPHASTSMGGARPPTKALRRVAQGYSSDISGRGAA